MRSGKTEQELDFEKLCEKMEELLKKYILYRTKDMHLTEDILQNVFLTATQNRNQVISHPNPKGWFMNTAKNLILKEYAANKAIADTEVELLDTIPAQSILDGLRRAALDEILLELSDKEEKIIQYHYYENMPLKETAEQLNEPYDTVKRRHSRLLRKLRERCVRAK